MEPSTKVNGICKPDTGTVEVIKYGATAAYMKDTGRTIKLMEEAG